jgi:diphosphomevalonate decarboxylase
MNITWKSPSNIALIKYWGKHGEQLPNNPSLSLTLSDASTTTSISLKKKRSKKPIDLDFSFEGKKNPAFSAKILTYLTGIQKDFNFLSEQRIIVESENSFPHSAGIASSASSMSAMALCLMSLKATTEKKMYNYDTFLQQASGFARLGSGSASRSIYPEFSVWGKTTTVPGSSDKYAIPFPINYHNDFSDMEDSILIINESEKSVSSRAGHALMNDHPMAKQRYLNANNRFKLLLNALNTGDWGLFCQIVETEALELHALMMTSTHSFILMKPNTLEIIERIRNFRAETKIPVCFTLDAGPNVHVLYPHSEKTKVRNFIQSELLPFCIKKKVIYDHMGKGPSQIMND